MSIASRVVSLSLSVCLVGCAPMQPATSATADDAGSSRRRAVVTSGQAAFLDDLERRTFDWFRDTTNAQNGPITPRSSSRRSSGIMGVCR